MVRKNEVSQLWEAFNGNNFLGVFVTRGEALATVAQDKLNPGVGYGQVTFRGDAAGVS